MKENKFIILNIKGKKCKNKSLKEKEVSVDPA